MIKKYKYHNDLLTISELMVFSKVTRGALSDRLDRGWPIEDALNKPQRAKGVNCAASKASISADISKAEQAEEKKIKDVGLFAICSARSSGDRR